MNCKENYTGTNISMVDHFLFHPLTHRNKIRSPPQNQSALVIFATCKFNIKLLIFNCLTTDNSQKLKQHSYTKQSQRKNNFYLNIEDKYGLKLQVPEKLYIIL